MPISELQNIEAGEVGWAVQSRGVAMEEANKNKAAMESRICCDVKSHLSEAAGTQREARDNNRQQEK